MTLNDWMKDINKAARKAANDWPGVTTKEDMVQDICVHIMERPGTVEDLAGMDRDARYQTIHKIAQRIASQDRMDYERFSGNFRHSVDEVRSLLESASDPERSEIGSTWSAGDHTRSGLGHSDPTVAAAIGNLLVSDTLKRLRKALASLKTSNASQYEALIRRFVKKQIPAREDTAAFMVIDRALVSVTTKMNHLYKQQHNGRQVPYKSLGGGPGSRKAISNSAARYLSKEGWDADYIPAPTHLRDNRVESEVWE